MGMCIKSKYLFSCLALLLLAKLSNGQNEIIHNQYTCVLTLVEYNETKEVKQKYLKQEEEKIKLLKKINPEYAAKYESSKSGEEKRRLVEDLINNKFSKVNIHAPENEHILRFLKSLNFAVVSAKDVDRCSAVIEGIKKVYDTLTLYYDPIPKSGCNIYIYNIVKKVDIDSIGCALKSLSTQYRPGELFVTFYDKEVTDTTKLERDFSEATITERGKGKIIDKIVVK
jgi:hypothetical protein